MDTFSAFQDLLESELVTDVLNRPLLAAKDEFLKSKRELEVVLSPVVGSNSWKAKFDGSEPVKPVLEHGVNTLLKISLRGVALQLVWLWPYLWFMILSRLVSLVSLQYHTIPVPGMLHFTFPTAQHSKKHQQSPITNTHRS